MTLADVMLAARRSARRVRPVIELQDLPDALLDSEAVADRPHRHHLHAEHRLRELLEKRLEKRNLFCMLIKSAACLI